MNMTSKLAVAGLVVALAACGKTTQSDVNQAVRDRAANVAKAAQNAQPSVDAANRNLAVAQQDANAKVTNAPASGILARIPSAAVNCPPQDVGVPAAQDRIPTRNLSPAQQRLNLLPAASTARSLRASPRSPPSRIRTAPPPAPTVPRPAPPQILRKTHRPRRSSPPPPRH